MTATLAQRVAIGALSLSAVGLTAYVVREGYAESAAPPIAGDVPTYGYGSTVDARGKPVVNGARIAPVPALVLAQRDLEMKEGRLKACWAGVKMTQYEYDAYVNLAGNVGDAAVCDSSITVKLKAGEFDAACRTILDFSKFCTQPKIRNAAGKKVCPPGTLKVLPGLLWPRQCEYLRCKGAVLDARCIEEMRRTRGAAFSEALP